jgi:hypothetical protein
VPGLGAATRVTRQIKKKKKGKTQIQFGKMLNASEIQVDDKKEK